MVLGPLIAFYLLVDLPKVRRGADGARSGARGATRSSRVGRRVGATLGSFFRGQLVVALLVGLASALGFWIIGLPVLRDARAR